METIKASQLDENSCIYKTGTLDEVQAFGAAHYTHDTGCIARFESGTYAWASKPVWLKRQG